MLLGKLHIDVKVVHRGRLYCVLNCKYLLFAAAHDRCVDSAKQCWNKCSTVESNDEMSSLAWRQRVRPTLLLVLELALCMPGGTSCETDSDYLETKHLLTHFSSFECAWQRCRSTGLPGMPDNARGAWLLALALSGCCCYIVTLSPDCPTFPVWAPHSCCYHNGQEFLDCDILLLDWSQSCPLYL